MPHISESPRETDFCSQQKSQNCYILQWLFIIITDLKQKNSLIKVQFMWLHKIFHFPQVNMKHQVRQVETLNEYAEYIYTLFCYKQSFTLSQVKAPLSQLTRDYNRPVKIALVSLKSKGCPKDKVRISKITSCDVLRRKSSTEDKTDASRTPGNSKK